MNRTRFLIIYIVSTFVSIIALIAFIRLPAIIFVGIEDYVLTLLFYLLSVLGIITLCLYIADFFIIRLGVYGIMRIENDNIIYRIEQIEKRQNNLNNAVFENKIKINNIKANN